MSYVNYAPYFRDGLLYIPQATAKMLIEAGYNSPLNNNATNGFRLDEDNEKIAQLNQQLQELIAEMDDTSAIKVQLTSSEVKFVFSQIEEFEDFAHA